MSQGTYYTENELPDPGYEGVNECNLTQEAMWLVPCCYIILFFLVGHKVLHKGGQMGNTEWGSDWATVTQQARGRAGTRTRSI